MLEAHSLLLPTWPNRANVSPSRGTVVPFVVVFFFRLAIFLKGFATREVEDCQELSFRHFDLEVVIRLNRNLSCRTPVA